MLPITAPTVPMEAPSLLRIAACSFQRKPGDRSPAVNPIPQRRHAAFKPTVWKDGFIQSLSSECKAVDQMRRMEVLKQEVKGLLVDGTTPLAKQLEMLDHLQRLGLGRHFEEEIQSILQTTCMAARDRCEVMTDDLSCAALVFRLLRQHGYRVSPAVFNSFVGEKGDFQSCLLDDTRAALRLYEASYHAYGMESLLDVARKAAAERLKSITEGTEDYIKEEAKHALELPPSRRIPRLQTRQFLDRYVRRPADVNRTLLELAILDFNMVQSIHQTSLKKMSSWWADLGLKQKLYFARDRLMENFFCSIAIIPEPEFSRCREKITQACCFISTIDDIYDEYGSYDELELFTDAVQRWNINAVSKLPPYMRPCYLALIHTVGQMSHELQREKGFNALPYLKKVWVDLCISFLVEAKWKHDKHMPTFEEYMDNAWISISVNVLITHAFLFMSLDIMEKELEYLQGYPKLIRYSATIFRLCNDLVEREGGDTPSSIVCYINENNATEEEARQHIKDLIDETWKNMNEELEGSTFPMAFTTVVANVARTGHCLYQHGDGHSNPGREFKNMLKSLLLDSI